MTTGASLQAMTESPQKLAMEFFTAEGLAGG
jgi:hypothetical protein